MSAIVAPDVEECYLLALLDGADGIDLAEWTWRDEENDDACFRAWDFQWPWYTCEDTLQIDQAGRSLGKSTGIQMRAFAFPFNFPGAEMLITAPELNHLRPLVDAVEARFLNTRIGMEMLPKTKGAGLSRQPHWKARFANGSRIESRLPHKDGKGVKGMHPLVLEADEMQDYPLAGWIELIETLKRGSKGAQWRCHGVSRGVRDKYYELTQADSDFTVHRYMAPHRPSWSKAEREEKIRTYGGSRQNPDYRRNIYGEHGDASNPLFVLARLMGCVDQDEGSPYNTDIYSHIEITYEQLANRDLDYFMDQLPGAHKTGYSQMSSELTADGRAKPPREVGSPKGYSAYYAGMDVGMTNHPSEILVFGQRVGTELLELLTRVHMQRISTEDQMEVIERLFAFYGSKLKAFALDRTGLGFSMWDILEKRSGIGSRIYGYNFSEKVAVGIEDRELLPDEDIDDLIIMRNVVEYASDALRNDYVDVKKLRLPFDREVLAEWQGQNYTVVKSAGNPYGKRDYAQGKFHTLDAGKMMAAGKMLPGVGQLIENARAASKHFTPVLDAFVGSY